MTAELDAGQTTAECTVLARYLVGVRPPETIRLAYLAGVMATESREAPSQPLIDRALLAVARQGVWGSAIADAYASRWRPTGVLRRRLTLLLAILESGPPLHQLATQGPSLRYRWIWARIPLLLVGSAVKLAVGTIVFGPVHLVSGSKHRSRARADR